ncbi:MAG: N-acetylmuramoyl-L-alanine amidase [Peptostreptococcaceae bacterium]|nr:N-acetylmuramoyl-L-alanine amidase [Peptostreptococcaceae bacterium]
MKKLFSIILSTFLMVNLSFVVSFGETVQNSELIESVQVSQVSQAAIITKADVSRGLLYCREYPVTVQIDDVDVPTKEKDVPPLIVGARTLIPVRAFFEALGATVEWDAENRIVTIENDGSTVELVIDSPVAKVEGKAKILEVPAMIIDHDEDGTGSTMVPLRFVSEGLGAEVSWIEATRTANIVPASTETEEEETSTFETNYGPLNILNSNAKEKMIVIDIGHGGKDTGSIGNQNSSDELYEKDVNLEIGLKVKDLLDLAGARYIFTRESDVSMELYDRPALANDIGADILVSIHNNSFDTEKPEGTEVYYYSKVDEQGLDEGALYGIYSKDIAVLVQKEMVDILGTVDRGAKESEHLAILRRSSMPAIIIEGAFMSNPGNLEKIRTTEFKEKYAYALVKGLITTMNSAF